ncbi:MAG: hypothetical protein JXJ04_20010 [Spirochaetales bacterium]|nr:hypothetical protein [Spirochaetales bacterium]
MPESMKLSLLSDMNRHNALAMVSFAGSGHLGTSFSSSEILTALYHNIMNITPENFQERNRDYFVLSKGHAAPGLYAVLASVGFIPEEQMLTFRKLDGLQGHSDIKTNGIDTNSGSLGMGLSKGKGFCWFLKSRGLQYKVYVLTGDGELQEGQIWEAIQTANAMDLNNLIMIIDHNKMQTDLPLNAILNEANLKTKIEAFGWDVFEIDGHNMDEIIAVFNEIKYRQQKPAAVICNTIKGYGVSFMQHNYPEAKNDLYLWHGKCPDTTEYKKACDEIYDRIMQQLNGKSGININKPFPMLIEPKKKDTVKTVVNGFSDGLVMNLDRNNNIVILDGDLAESCGLNTLRENRCDRFIEVGIAEQDMISMAGALASTGLVPVVNTFTSFLTSRANEQIFNNSTEGRKVVYAGHLAGLVPAKPGKSHQGIRDISLLASIPGIIMIEPSCYREVIDALDFLLHAEVNSGYLRISHAQSKRVVTLPDNYIFKKGEGCILEDGDDLTIISYGPVILGELLLVSEYLKEKDIHARIINLPWLNFISREWFTRNVFPDKPLFCVENHYYLGGQADCILRLLADNYNAYDLEHFHSIGIHGFGQSGDDEEILELYGLSAGRIFKYICQCLEISI